MTGQLAQMDLQAKQGFEPVESTGLKIPGANDEQDGPIEVARESYVVRLGDTLRSVAMKHPQLQDVSLWVLLAEVNKLPIAIEVGAETSTRLVRGSRLMMPTAEEIAQYRKHQVSPT